MVNNLVLGDECLGTTHALPRPSRFNVLSKQLDIDTMEVERQIRVRLSPYAIAIVVPAFLFI
jgi:hypothetical protein